MHQIPLGTKGTFTLRVRPEHLANQFKDAMLPEVFSTPMMVLIMENAALNAIRSFLEPGESAVGSAINIRHLAATPPMDAADLVEAGNSIVACAVSPTRVTRWCR